MKKVRDDLIVPKWSSKGSCFGGTAEYRRLGS